MRLTVERKKPEPTVPPIERVVLELNEREARALAALCRAVGGSPYGPRGAITAMADHFKGAGIDEPSVGWIIQEPHTGSIYFREEWPK